MNHSKKTKRPKAKNPKPTTEAASKPLAEKPLFPMRINRYVALEHQMTRRSVDELISKRKVFINDRLAVLGDKVDEGDVVEIRTKKEDQKTFIYLAYNKPAGLITHAQHKGEMDIMRTLEKSDPSFRELLKKNPNIFPVGRLDKNSHGLIILTNDGRITDRLLNPSHEHTKEYEVTTTIKLRPNFKEKMEAGVNIEGYVTKNCHVTILGEKKFKIELTEGKKHQIRRMISALFNEVDDLKRTAVMNIRLEKLNEKAFRLIKGDELDAFLKSLGL